MFGSRRPIQLHFTLPQKSAAETTVVRNEYTERSRAFMSAIAKIPISTPENDGSHRLVMYARQAKRFMSNEDDALRVVKAAATLHPFPVDWSDDQILRRISQVDIKEFGEGFMVDTTESWKHLKTVGGVPINGSAEKSVAPASPDAQTPAKPEPKPDPLNGKSVTSMSFVLATNRNAAKRSSRDCYATARWGLSDQYPSPVRAGWSAISFGALSRLQLARAQCQKGQSASDRQ